MRRLTFCLILTLSISQFVHAQETTSKNSGAPVFQSKIVSLEIQPSPLIFSSPTTGRRVLVLGNTPAGEKIDLTSIADFELTRNILSIDKDGYLIPLKTGDTRIIIRASQQEVELPVTVKNGAIHEITFLRNVLPIMNKVGCTAGTCHGAAKGRNGFKLSLRGYDPEFDYQSLLYDMSGRRFNRAAPAQSLLLAKPTQEVAHGGGLQIEHGSPYYDTLFTWISAGVPFGDPAIDKVERLEVVPSEIFMHGPEREQQVLVVAHYPDGSVRDVTREAHLTSSNTESALIREGAVVKGLRQGEGALLVRYEGKFLAVPMTILNPATGFSWKDLPRHNYIDEQIDTKLKRLKIQPSPRTSDAEFLRRVSLDLTGQLPSTKRIRQFVSEKSSDKRSRIIDELIDSEAYIDHWTLKWGDLLRSNSKFMGTKGVWIFREWLRQSIAKNKPYDTFVQELLTSKGSTFENPAANFFRVGRTPQETMEATTQLFLGVRMVCAQCHDHPFEKWTQNQYFQMSAFFAPIGIRPGFQSGEEIVYLKRYDNQLEHPKYGGTVEPKYLVPSHNSTDFSAVTDPRQPLSEWLTSKENPFFTRAIVNRVWSYFFGRGIIEPVDDIRASNPPVNNPLLTALALDFTEHDFDLRQLMRTIVNSRTYQASLQSNQWNTGDTINFSHRLPRRLTAEQLSDAISVATGSHFEFPNVPKDFQASQLPDPHVGMDDFLDLFGRPQRELPCECERKNEMSLPQAMNLINGPTLANAVADPEGRVAKLILGGANNREVTDELYLATLSRLPNEAEYKVSEKHLKDSGSRTGGAQDLLWALLNSNAFLFNR